MTKTVPERFAEIIELLILAIEAHLLGSYLPNRLAAPLSWRVRSSLEGVANSFAEAFAKFIAAAATRAAAAARSLDPAPAPRAQTPAPIANRPTRIPISRANTARRRRVTPSSEPSRAMPGLRSSPAPQPAIRALVAQPRRATPIAPAPRPRKPPNRKNRLLLATYSHAHFVTI